MRKRIFNILFISILEIFLLALYLKYGSLFLVAEDFSFGGYFSRAFFEESIKLLPFTLLYFLYRERNIIYYFISIIIFSIIENILYFFGTHDLFTLRQFLELRGFSIFLHLALFFIVYIFYKKGFSKMFIFFLVIFLHALFNFVT